MGIFDKFIKNNVESDMIVIVGLGNMGDKYKNTKHNIGFDVIDLISEKYNIKVDNFKHKGFIGKGEIEGKSVLLVKPQTYMNLSGECVREVVNFYKVPQSNFLVIYDDISLPIGKIRIREKGSHGGQNGVKNIINIMGTNEFPRIKVGIGDKPNGWDLADYVLAKFNKDDLPLALSGMEKAVEGVELFLSSGLTTAMNKLN